MTLSADQQQQLEEALRIAHNYLDHPMVQPLLERLAVTLKMIHTPQPQPNMMKTYGMDLVDVIAEDLIREIMMEANRRTSLP